MNLQKKLASQIMKCSPKRVKLDPAKLNEIKEAITKFDVSKLLNKGLIKVNQKKGISRFRAKEIQKKKKKGRKKGQGSRKGRANARLNRKEQWINTIRLQREFLKRLKKSKKVNHEDHKMLYYKAGGGFFRSLNHLKVYMNEKGILK